jgi:hypothetical protein
MSHLGPGARFGYAHVPEETESVNVPPSEKLFDELESLENTPLKTQDLAWRTPQSDAQGPIRPNGKAIASIAPPAGSGFPGLIYHLWRRQSTGILHLRAEGVESVLYLDRGTPVYAERGKLGDTLGRFLVRVGRITEEDFARASRHMSEALDRDERVRFGDVLVKLGILTAAQVDEALELQIRQKVVSCFEWPNPKAWFDPDELRVRSVPHVPCPVPELLTLGCLQGAEEDEIDQLFTTFSDQYVGLSEPVEDLVRDLALMSSDAAIVEGIDGSRTLRALLEANDWDGASAGPILIGLLRMGVLSFSRTPITKASARAESDEDGDLDFHLDVVLDEAPKPARRVAPPPPATMKPPPPSRVINAAPAPTKTLDLPKPAASPSRTADLPKMGDVAKIKGTVPARDVVPQAARQKEYTAESCFIAGKERLDRGERKGAVEMFRMAVEKSPETLEYRLYAAYAEFLHCKDPEEAKSYLKKAKEVAQAATRQDPQMFKAHYVLGHLTRVEGETDAAIKHFRRALDLHPQDRETERELRLLNKRNEETKGKDKKKLGFFKWGT